jgi:hypothetical protein
MNLSKRLILLKHIDKFIFDQYELGQSTSDILGMLKYKSERYKESEKTSTGLRRTYLNNYILLLNKRVIDFQYFRKKNTLKEYRDTDLFKLIDFRDRIIFKKIFKD